MEESLKNRVILILVILTAIFFIGTIGSCASAHRNKVAFNREMTSRLNSEEQLNKFTQEKTALENKMKAATQELDQEKTAHEATNKALLQEQLINQSLKDELQKVTKLKDTLEENLKDALVTGKAARQKK